MDSLIGISKINGMMKVGRYVATKEMVPILESFGVKAIGLDHQKNFLWTESSIQSVVDRLESVLTAPVVERAAEQASSQSQTSQVFIDEISDLLETIKRQNQQIHGKLSAEFDILKKHSGTPIELDGEASEKVITELSGFISSFMADQQRALVSQVDSFMNSIDDKLLAIQKLIQAHGSAINQTNKALAEVQRITNNIISNVHTTNLVTREELTKRFSRVEKAMDDLRGS